VAGYAARLRKYKTRLLRYWQNFLFSHNEKRFYFSLEDNKSLSYPDPDISELQEFWKCIFEKQSRASLQSVWLDELNSSLYSDKTFVMEDPVLDTHCFVSCLKRSRNWAAPGPDGVQGFWIKRFPSLHDSLLNCFNEMLNDGSVIPSWLPIGRTMLTPKNQYSQLTKNYRPNTCLNILYKLWTSCLTQILTRHYTVNDVLQGVLPRSAWMH